MSKQLNRIEIKQPNAFKHGGFAAATILPTEDERDLKNLIADLCTEWMPEGITELDAVGTIAKAMWRKRRVQNFRAIQVYIDNRNPHHALYNEGLVLAEIAEVMRTQPDSFFEERAKYFLRADKIAHLNEKFPREDFKSASAWKQAVMNEITSVLVPACPDPHLAETDFIAAFEQDGFEKALALDERLDAIIERAVKRLVQTKAVKQLLRQTSNEEAQPGIARSTSNRSGRSMNRARRSGAGRTKPAEQAA